MTATQWAIIAICALNGFMHWRVGFAMLFFFAVGEAYRLTP